MRCFFGAILVYMPVLQRMNTVGRKRVTTESGARAHGDWVGNMGYGRGGSRNGASAHEAGNKGLRRLYR